MAGSTTAAGDASSPSSEGGGLSDSSEKPSDDKPSESASPEETTSSDSEGTEQSVNLLQVGQCFNDAPGESGNTVSKVLIVDCSQPHSYEVYNNYQSTLTEYPSTEEAKTNETAVACRDAFTQYVGIDISSSTTYSATVISPTETGWSRGDRTYTCLIVDPNELPMTGSARGAAR